MTYTLTVPTPEIQDITAIGGDSVTEGVSTSSGIVGWKDGSNNVHMLGHFGGFVDASWNGHYIDVNTPANSAILPDVAPGTCWAFAYHSDANKLYILANHQDSFTEFDPTGPSATVISTSCGAAGHIRIGTDSPNKRVYVATSGLGAVHVWSYDPLATPPVWFDYGAVPSNDGEQNDIKGTASDGVHVFVAVRKNDNTQTVFICPVSSANNWTEWEFGSDGDLMTYIGWNADTSQWCAERILSDNSTHITYYLGGDSPYYHWISNTGFNESNLINGPTHCVNLGSDDLSDPYKYFAHQIGYDLDFTDFYPVKDVHEYSLLKYAVHDSGTWVSSNIDFTGPWVSQTTRQTLPLSGTTMFCLSQDYNAAFSLNYPVATRSRTYLGGEILGPYVLREHPTSGEWYAGGYSNFVWRYNPGAEWTLIPANATPVSGGGTPGEDGRPNPYRIDLPGTIYHYRHGIDFDANGLVWIGGNTTRLSPDYGNVGWYNPSNGTTGYLYDWTSGILFRSICSCLNRSKILVFSNDNVLHRIDADNQTDDNVDITDSGGYGYMIETSNDRVFVVHFSAGPTYKVGILKPSDMTWVVDLSSTPLSGLGVPFGFPESLYLRMYRKLELGPDGFVWMQVGTTIYRIDPTQDPLVFEDIADVGTSAALKFAANNTDLILYNLNANSDGGDTDVKYIQGILTFEGYSKGAYPSLPGNDDDLLNVYTDEQVADVAVDDTDMVAQLATSQIAIHQFKQQINGAGGIINTVARVTVPCSTSTAYLQIYNRSGTPAWDTIDSDNATGANTDFTLSATVADLTDYKDENNIVTCRVYQEMQ